MCRILDTKHYHKVSKTRAQRLTCRVSSLLFLLVVFFSKKGGNNINKQTKIKTVYLQCMYSKLMVFVLQNTFHLLCIRNGFWKEDIIRSRVNRHKTNKPKLFFIVFHFNFEWLFSFFFLIEFFFSCDLIQIKI